MYAVITEFLYRLFTGRFYHICNCHNSKELFFICKKKWCPALFGKCLDLVFLFCGKADSFLFHHLLISGIVVCTGHCTFDSFSK